MSSIAGSRQVQRNQGIPPIQTAERVEEDQTLYGLTRYVRLVWGRFWYYVRAPVGQMSDAKVVQVPGLEPGTSPLPRECSTN